MTETGRIIKIVSSRYEVLAANQERVLCVAMGKLRKAHSPVVGDLVEFERFADQNGIQKILPRKNALVRPSIANVDQAIIVMSCKDPDFYASPSWISSLKMMQSMRKSSIISTAVMRCIRVGKAMLVRI